jgi:hypothetical protein
MVKVPTASDQIRISPTMSFPPEAVTETFGFLAMRGAGKSNAVVVMAEEMYRLGLPWVAIDPKGDWFGIRSNVKGTGPGLPIPIFGGLHGDLPLEPEAGAFIADLIVRENLTCILDVSEFASKAKQVRFLADFADRLYRNHGRHPQPRHIFAEEADEYIPQRVMADMARCVGAWEQIIKRGRQRGLGCSIVTQRSASINKDALSQVLTLIVLRTTSPHDRKAILGWVDYHAAGREIVDALPELPSGEAWVISPQWLGRTERIKFNRRSTFDSGDTPTMGTARKVATLADIDLGSLTQELAAIVERALADDPKALKRRIAELERLVAQKSPAPAKVEIRTETVEVPVPFIPESIPKMIGEFRAATEKFFSNIETAIFDAATQEPSRAPVRRSPPVVREPVQKVPITVVSARRSPPTSTPLDGDVWLPKEKTILTVLAQFPDGRSRRQLAMLSGYSSKSGGFNNALAKLRTAGLINKSGEPVKATPEGLAAIDGMFEPLPIGRALLEHWNSKLGKAERMILGVCIEAWPESLTRDQVAEITGYSGMSGGFNNALAKLRTLELISRGTEIFADETLAQEVHNG